MLSNPAIIKRAVLVGAALAVIGAAAAPVRAQSPEVALFKVVTVKDEIVVGIPNGELAAMGGDASAIARRLIGKGEMTLTRFAVRKNAAGDLEFQRVGCDGYCPPLATPNPTDRQDQQRHDGQPP